MLAGKLDRRIRVLRHRVDDQNAMGEPEDTWTPVETVRAAKMDVSDAERVRAAGVGASLTTRFLVRRSRVTETITFEDRLWYGAKTYEITGLKEAEDNKAIEITATLLREVKG